MGIRIRGMITVVPDNFRTTEDLGRRFGQAEAERAAKLTGVHEAPVVFPGQTIGDLGVAAATRLLERLGLAPRDLDGIILVTQSPDFFLPATACILQDRLGMPKRSVAFDMNQGCSGYPYGLAVTCGLISLGVAQRILLLVGDTSSVRVHPEDKGSAPLFGDSLTATLVERDDAENDLLGLDLGTDGSGWANLVIPVGHCRYLNVDDFRARAPTKLQGIAQPAHLYMNGAEIFTFTLREVPGIVERTLKNAGRDAASVDYFFLHQANKFILDHLIRKMGFPPAKCPISIDRYGNTSGASPAVTACHAIADINRDRELTAMFVGFGVGYSWGGALVRLRPGTVFPVEKLDEATSLSFRLFGE